MGCCKDIGKGDLGQWVGSSQARGCWKGKPLSCLVAPFRSLHPCYSLPVSACHFSTSVCSRRPLAQSQRDLPAPEAATIWPPLRSHLYVGDPGLTGYSPCWVINFLPNWWRRRGHHRVKKHQWGRLAAGGEGGSPGCPEQEKCGWEQSAWRGSDPMPGILTDTEIPSAAICRGFEYTSTVQVQWWCSLYFHCQIPSMIVWLLLPLRLQPHLLPTVWTLKHRMGSAWPVSQLWQQKNKK